MRVAGLMERGGKKRESDFPLIAEANEPVNGLQPDHTSIVRAVRSPPLTSSHAITHHNEIKSACAPATVKKGAGQADHPSASIDSRGKSSGREHSPPLFPKSPGRQTAIAIKRNVIVNLRLPFETAAVDFVSKSNLG